MSPEPRETSTIHMLRLSFNTLRPRQDGRHFADSFTCIFFNENCCILIKFSFKYVRKGPVDNNRALVQIMAWRQSGDKPLSEPMMISLPTHICVTRPQWVKPAVNFGLIVYLKTAVLLSGVPDYFDCNKILSGYDLSHYQVPHCIRVFFYFVWFVFYSSQLSILF